MKTIYKVLLSVSVAAVCWSCSKDYLDTNPSSSTSAATFRFGCSTTDHSQILP